MNECYKNKQRARHATETKKKYNAVNKKWDENQTNLEKVEIFFKVGGYKKGFMTINRGTLGIFLHIEQSYAASPLLYTNSWHDWRLARYRQRSENLGS